jgi:hypothetical protein
MRSENASAASRLLKCHVAALVAGMRRASVKPSPSLAAGQRIAAAEKAEDSLLDPLATLDPRSRTAILSMSP